MDFSDRRNTPKIVMEALNKYREEFRKDENKKRNILKKEQQL